MGALGEVGRSLGRTLTDLGNDVTPVSSRHQTVDPGVLPLEAAVQLITAADVDLVVHAGGRGDKRSGERDPLEATGHIGLACEQGGVRGVLISTVRVLEDAAGPLLGSADPDCHSDYARVNATNEQRWLSAAPSQGYVVRLANYFCAPSGGASPQTQLLPWSLVTEALSSGRITVRSAPTVAREFVSAHDAVMAVLTVARALSPARVSSTTPGYSMNLEQLTHVVGEAFERNGRVRPFATFGDDAATGPVLQSDWLADHGWSCTVTPEEMIQVVGNWLFEHHSMSR